MKLYSFRSYLQKNAKGLLQEISMRADFPKRNKDKMICFIHMNELPPELVFELDDLCSDYYSRERR